MLGKLFRWISNEIIDCALIEREEGLQSNQTNLDVSKNACVWGCIKDINKYLAKIYDVGGSVFHLWMWDAWFLDTRDSLIFGIFKMSRYTCMYAHITHSRTITHTNAKLSSSPSLMVQTTISNKMCPPLYVYSSLYVGIAAICTKLFNVLFLWFALTQPIVHATCLFMLFNARFIHLSIYPHPMLYAL